MQMHRQAERAARDWCVSVRGPALEDGFEARDKPISALLTLCGGAFLFPPLPGDAHASHRDLAREPIVSEGPHTGLSANGPTVSHRREQP